MISNQCQYALRALIELARREGVGPVPIAEVAEAQDIPGRFLEAILRQLKQAGFADSVRGKEGGYFLARPPRDIPIGEVVRLFEGRLTASGSTPVEGVHPAAAVLDEVWQAAECALSAVYDALSVGELAERVAQREALKVPDYAI